MSKVTFTIPGKMRGKGRHRVGVVAGHARAFSDPKTVASEAMVRAFGNDAMMGRPVMTGPIRLTINVMLLRPKSWSRRKVAENPFPTGKPDLDNVVKLIGDALNGVVWRDDSQIAFLTVFREFVSDAERTLVCVEAMLDEPGALAVAA